MASLPLTARENGSFNLRLGVPHSNENKLYPKQERVIRGLLAKATECRYFSRFGPRNNPLKPLLKKIAKYRNGSWEFDLSMELITGYEPIWNDRMIVIVTEASPQELAPTLAASGKSLSSDRTPLWKIVDPKSAARDCRKVVRKRDAAAFLVYGVSNVYCIEVFARERRLAQLWKVLTKKGMPPELEEEPAKLHVRFGTPKNMHKVPLRQCLRHPIWVSTGLEEEDYDEEHETPIISTKNVSASLLEEYKPRITLRVKDAKLYGSGYYHHQQGELSNICVWRKNRWVGLEQAKLSWPLTFIAVPSILGRKNVAFRCDDPGSDIADRVR